VILFLSSAFFPYELMQEPAASIAEFNPVSFIVEGVRDPVISTLTGEDALKAFVSIIAIIALSLSLSAGALRHRLRTGG
jgi:ABC-2 type transport system permease protein